MNIAATEYSIGTKSFDIYISGCKGYCKGCCNPELQNPDFGDELSVVFFETLRNKMRIFDSLVDNIFIMGGEPLDQEISSLKLFLEKISLYNKPIWLFTHFSLEEIPEDIKQLCSYIKTGKYDMNNLVDNNIQYGVKLASGNQTIHKIR
jgi:anaerobic ribonucleoside-triphosphate reductase activating protein